MEQNSLYLKLTTVIFKTMQHMEKVIQDDIKSYGLNTTEFGALELLYNRGRQPMQSISNRMLMPSSSLTYVIDKLESRKFITREISPKDKRVTMIELTKEGISFFDQIFPSHIEKLKVIYSKLSEEELKLLIDSIKKVGYQAMEISEKNL
jgi:MarR family transcriptional regulator, 2-MHQ and catechol-resistance regulon repressor